MRAQAVRRSQLQMDLLHKRWWVWKERHVRGSSTLFYYQGNCGLLKRIFEDGERVGSFGPLKEELGVGEHEGM